MPFGCFLSIDGRIRATTDSDEQAQFKTTHWIFCSGGYFSARSDPRIAVLESEIGTTLAATFDPGTVE
jgi:hypothetical protein